jgi:hypothetical protein
VGPAGPPGDLLLIQDAEGRPVVEAAKVRLGLPALESAVTTAVSWAPFKPFEPRIIIIRSPELRQLIHHPSGRYEWPPALPGKQGPPGPTDAVPLEARPPRLGPEEVAALLSRLEEDAELKTRIDGLRQRILR